jgi:rRNA maturation RNase YbeY
MIDLVLTNRTKSRAFGRAFFAHVCMTSLSALRIPRGHRAEVGITLVGKTAMRTLNRTRRRIDAPTDVLSFPLHMKPITGYTAVLVGDLFICPDVVRSLAQESGLPVRQRMAWTIVHGLLHLAGYDHEKGPAEAKRMFATERKILNRLNL